MAHIFFLLAVVVLYSSQIQGSSAVTPVFVKRGDDVLLEVMDKDPKEFDILVWKFNTSNVLVTYSPGGRTRVSEGYTGRVEFSVENYSVKLKNLQDADSGVYTAQVTADKEQPIAEYMVTVQGPVSPVDLNPDSVSISSDSCNLTVTCSTEDSDISSTFRCDTKTCSQEGGEQSKVTNSGASLHVHLLNETIICNHSNQVSWTKNTTKIQDFCSLHAGPVSPVDLNPDSVSNSSDSCNLTVTCSTEDSDISSTFRCDTKTCSQEGGEQSKVTNSGASLRVYLLNEAIICNHSNQISSMKNTTQIQDFCPLHADSETNQLHIIVIVCAVIAVVGLIVVVACCYHHKRVKNDRENIENTENRVYDVPEDLNQRSADDDSGLSPTSTYSLIGPHTGPKGSTKTKEKNLPETLYAMVEKPFIS